MQRTFLRRSRKSYQKFKKLSTKVKRSLFTWFGHFFVLKQPDLRQVLDEVRRFFFDLGLAHEYFENTTSQDIANHIVCLYAAKMFHSISGSEFGLDVKNEHSDSAFYVTSVGQPIHRDAKRVCVSEFLKFCLINPFSLLTSATHLTYLTKILMEKYQLLSLRRYSSLFFF